MTQLPCPGEPVVDFIFAGDSSMALVDEGLYADGTVKRTKRNVGEFLKAGRMDLLTEKAGSAQYSMHWGKGLKEITDGIEACLDNKARRTPGGVAPAVVVVSYAGNDVYGNYGYVGNPWVTPKSSTGTERSSRPRTRGRLSWRRVTPNRCGVSPI